MREVQGADGRRIRRAKAGLPAVVSTLHESANACAGIVAAERPGVSTRRAAARRIRTPQTSRDEHLVGQEPAAGREARAGRPASTLEEPARERPAEGAARAAGSRPRRAGSPRRAGARGSPPRPRPRRVDRLAAARRQAGRRAVGRRERGDVAVEASGVPAAGRAVERVRARARPPRTAGAASTRGCAGSRGPAAPSCRSRSRASPAVAEAVGREVVLGRRPVVVLLGRARVAPARGPARRRQVVAVGPVSPSASGSSSVSA